MLWHENIGYWNYVSELSQEHEILTSEKFDSQQSQIYLRDLSAVINIVQLSQLSHVSGGEIVGQLKKQILSQSYCTSISFKIWNTCYFRRKSNVS